MGLKFGSRRQRPDQRFQSASDTEKQPVPADIGQCETELKKIFGKSSDIVIQRFMTRKGEALFICVDGMSNKDLIDRDILAPLKAETFDGDIAYAMNAAYQMTDDLFEAIREVLSGNTALFYKNEEKAFIIDFKQWDNRSVEVPEAEAVIRGPKEGFVENIRTNTSLLRRKIKTPKLIIESLVLGKQTNTSIALAYVEGIVNTEALEIVRARLAEINTDAILETGYIEQYLERRTFSLISSFGLTQKPDVLAARILEGRIGILCDGTPHALTVPHLFIENLQSAEDYYSRTPKGIYFRLFRLFALFISLYLPGMFLAVGTYHHEMVPGVFLSTIISAIEKTPLPLGAEIFFLGTMFELLRESGTRLPKAIGPAISIVGALIIGEAAVNAGIVSAPVVIVVALTAVCSFVNSSLNEFMMAYRYIFLFAGGTMGLIGIASVTMIMLSQIASSDSFGGSTLSTYTREDLRDNPLRLPLWSMKFRPSSIAGENKRRQK